MVTSNMAIGELFFSWRQ